LGVCLCHANLHLLQEALSRHPQVSINWLYLSFVEDDSTPGSNATLNQRMHFTRFLPQRPSRHPDPTTPFPLQPERASAPDLQSSAVGQGAICKYAEFSHWGDTLQQIQPLRIRKSTAKEDLGVAWRFTQTLLMKVLDCIDTNPVKMAFSFAKAIIEIKNVGRRRFCVLGTG